MMLRLVALAALCCLSLAHFDAQSEITALRESMEKRVEVLNSKLLNSALSCSCVFVSCPSFVYSAFSLA